MLLSRFVVGMLSVGLMVLGTSGVSGQDYPNKPIRIITGPAGGGDDFDARQVAQGISSALGQPVIVDNRVGAPIQGELLSKAPSDGYTLLVSGAVLWVVPFLQKVPYDMAGFSPISLIEKSVSVIVVHPSLPAKSIKELIALAKAKPGELNYSTTLAGGAPHLSGELFKSMAGINIVRVPYKATAAAMTALIGGETQMMIPGAVSALGQVKSGKLRALAVTSAQPSALAPGLPTVAASGLPGYESVSMAAIFAPAKTPAAIINRLNQEIVRFLNRADVKEMFFNVGVDVVGSSSEELTATLKSETAKWSKVIKDAGIKAD